VIARVGGAYSWDGNVGRQSFSVSDVRGLGGVNRALVGIHCQLDFGLSRQDIRIPAVAGAAVIAVLVAVEFFGKKLRKPS
jgi:hypothetical protein